MQKPIKRNEAFVEFSKDHHFALLLVFKIRQDLSKKVGTEVVAKNILVFFRKDLQDHFKEEEEFIFSKLPHGDPLRVQAENEHRRIYELVENIRANGTNETLLKKFAEVLELHIRFEERTLFNHLQEKMNPGELEELLFKVKNTARRKG